MSSLLSALAPAISQLVEEANTLASRVAASSETTANKLVFEAVQDSDDPVVVKFRQFKEAALAKINEQEEKIYAYVREQLAKKTGDRMTPEEIEAAKATHSDIRAKYRAAMVFAKLQPDFTPAFEASLPEMLSFRGGSSSAGKTGIARPRIAFAAVDGTEVSVLKDTKDGKVRGTSFSAVAAEVQRLERADGQTECKVTASELFEAAKATASQEGHPDWTTATAIEFAYAGKNHNYMIKVHPATK